MKLMIASDIHGSAFTPEKCWRPTTEKKQTSSFYWGIFSTMVHEMTCQKSMRQKKNDNAMLNAEESRRFCGQRKL